MLNHLIEWSVRNRLLVLIALAILTASSALMLPKLNLDAFPDVTNVQVAINTEAPGLASEEVEQLITFPIESVMYALPDVAEVRSISKTGLSLVTVVFNDNVDVYFARQLVFERLQAAKEMIPDGVGMPSIGPNTSGLGQVYQYLLIADETSGMDAMALRSLNDWLVKLLIMPVDGITDVLSFGGEVQQYQVNVNPAKLLSYGLTLEDVHSAIENNNTNAGGWYMNRGQEQLVIRGFGWLDSDQKGITQLKQIPLKTLDGATVYVADVAKVELGGEIRQGAVTITRRLDSVSNSEKDYEQLGEVVSGIVLKRMGANTKATIDGINERVKLVQQALPEGVRFEPLYDQADLVSQAVSTVVNALLLAFVFIVLILALFLMNLSATFLVLISIPISIGLALMIMSYLGMSANLMSLGGLAVAIGMLVDGSVVMVENIFKHLSQDSPENRSPDHKNSGYALRIMEAGKEVARPIFFAAMIILVVFAPLFSFEGVEAKLFQPMAISIMLAVLAAVVVALLVVPALASYLFARGVKVRNSPLLTPIDKAYQKALAWSLNRPKAIIAGAATGLVITALLIPHIGTEFVPELEEGTLNVRATLAPSSSLQTAIDASPKLEEILMQFPEVTYALSRVGRPELGGDPEPVSNIEIYVGLKPVAQWTSAENRIELQKLMQEKLEQFPGLLFTFSQPIATRVDELLSGVKAQLAIKLFGPQLNVLAEQGKAIENAVKTVTGTTGVAMEQISGEAQLVIRPNRQQLSRFGLAVGDVMQLVNMGIGGQSAGQIIKGNERYDIYVRLEDKFRNNIQTIEELRIQSPTGAWLRLKDIATIKLEAGPPQIRRDDVQRRVVIQANVEGRDMGSVVADIRQVINDQVALPPGYSVSIGGQFENQQRAQQRLSIVVPISIVLIALLLYFAFNSVGQALLILVNVPLAIIGGIVALYISGQYLSVPSAVGFITLFGVAVLNGVVLVESINQRIQDQTEKAVDIKRAIFEGTVSRLRPVLMTALTSALGLIPMLLSNGTGAEIQKPLATVIVGGLFSATLLTLFVLPVLFEFFSKQKLNPNEE